jgi:hypothetical protein
VFFGPGYTGPFFLWMLLVGCDDFGASEWCGFCVLDLVGAELPLSCGARVTFFACAKKVTKESTFKIWRPQVRRYSLSGYAFAL